MDGGTQAMRDKGLQMIKVGKEKFNSCEKYEEKKAGYDLLVGGIQQLYGYSKYETNPEIIKVLRTKLNEFIAEAEAMKKVVDNLNPEKKNTKPGTGTGTGVSKIQPSPEEKDNSETKQFEGALSEAIVREKPNVKWDDVAGLENAKQALQEAVILPTKFPQIFQGAIKPWKGILLYGVRNKIKIFSHLVQEKLFLQKLVLQNVMLLFSLFLLQI